MTLPNFLMLGAAKAGTTSLYYYVKQHPQVYMPEKKEPDFFALEGEKLDYPGPKGTFSIKGRISDLESYLQLFEGVTTEIAIGEASTSYLYSEKAPHRIKHYIPNAKLIAILREPVERAFSHYLYWTSQGFEPETDFDFSQAIKAEKDRIQKGWYNTWHYVQAGFYSQQLERYYHYFDPTQIKVYLYEDLMQNKDWLFSDIFEFLEVDSSFSPITKKTHNKTTVPKNKIINDLFNRKNLIKSLFKPLIPSRIRKNVGQYIKEKNTGKPQLSPAIRQQLKALYREDILKVQDMIDRDLSSWL